MIEPPLRARPAPCKAVRRKQSGQRPCDTIDMQVGGGGRSMHAHTCTAPRARGTRTVRRLCLYEK
jgi:hypothetical protein